MADFQADKEHIILCQIQAGGVGISLHDEHGVRPRVALISPTFNPVDLRQALGRVHRATGKTTSLQKIIFAADTIEEDACKKVKKKLAEIDLMNDGNLAEALSF